MSDQFLNDMRREPRREFADELQTKLRKQGPATAAGRATHFVHRFRPALVAAGVVLVATSFTLSPTLRLQAKAFLDLFRVSNFTAVSIDPERIAENFNSENLDIKALLGDQVEEFEKSGPPVSFSHRSEAEGAAGFRVREPASVPLGLVSDEYLVTGAAGIRMTVDGSWLRELVDGLGLDVDVPRGIDGAAITVRTSPTVVRRYRNEDLGVEFIQAKSPEVSVPAGLDIEQLGELGMLIAGVEPREARRLAKRIDWRNTLVVPVPSNAMNFRNVDLGGTEGLLITTNGAPSDHGFGDHFGGKRGSVLLWARDGMVYGLIGNIRHRRLVEMAMSLQ